MNIQNVLRAFLPLLELVDGLIFQPITAHQPGKIECLVSSREKKSHVLWWWNCISKQKCQQRLQHLVKGSDCPIFQLLNCIRLVSASEKFIFATAAAAPTTPPPY